MRRVALIPEQVRVHGLPSTPLKATERRADRWQQAMGVAQTEIDALAALQPALLRRMARDAINAVLRSDPDQQVQRRSVEWRDACQEAVDEQTDQEHLDEIAEQANEVLETVREQIKALEEQIRIDPRDYALPDRPDLPEPEITVEPDGMPLVDFGLVLGRAVAPADRLQGLRRRGRMTALARPNALTLASADVSLAKRITVIDGVVTRTDDPPWPRILTFETVEVGSPDDLLDVLSSAADQNPAPCVVRGDPLTEFGRRAIYDDPEEGPAGLRIMPRSWVGYDIERVPADGIDPLREPERTVAKARRCLPPEHHEAGVVWQITASAGRGERATTAPLVPARPPDARTSNRGLVQTRDQLGLARPCHASERSHPSLRGVKIVGNSPDPCPCRWGLIRGERNAVAVPDSVLALPERIGRRRSARSAAISPCSRRGTGLGSMNADRPVLRASRMRSRCQGGRLRRAPPHLPARRCHDRGHL